MFAPSLTITKVSIINTHFHGHGPSVALGVNATGHGVIVRLLTNSRAMRKRHQNLLSYGEILAQLSTINHLTKSIILWRAWGRVGLNFFY
jgi:hypothetical protein